PLKNWAPPPSPQKWSPPPPPTGSRLGGTWRELPRSPFAAPYAFAVWAGDRMVAIDPWRGRTATYYPPTRRWEEHQRIPGENAANGETISGPLAVRAGREVIVLGYRDTPDSSFGVGYAFDPARGRWREIAPPPMDGGREAAWIGDLLVVASRDRSAAAYDPVADCWLQMPEVPLPELPENEHTWRDMEWEARSLHWTGDELLAVVGTDVERVPVGIVSFDPRTWTWDPGPQAPPSIRLSNPILADGLLWFMFEDTLDDHIVDATYDPVTKLWAAVDIDCPISSWRAVWTGRLIMEPMWDRHAYDPRTGQCFRTPRLKDRARTSGATVWTGREYIVWSGAYGDSGRAFPDGIVYRPPRSAITAEKARPIGKKLRRAIAARRELGFDGDPDVVRRIMADPYQPGSRMYGFPMTEEEQRDLRRGGLATRASDAKSWLRRQPIYGGIWLDQRTGGDIVIALTEAAPDVIDEIDRRFVPYGGETPWRLVIVPRTFEDLRVAFRRAWRVSKELDSTAMLWAVGLDESAGAITMMYDPDNVKRMRAHKKKLEKELGVPVRITSGRVRDS
ncbi:MAG: hypothetical protein U9O18_05260, partial [Chloroflexota bacterium]|nr:hypothetical protein [Chloroflexota bacterium]